MTNRTEWQMPSQQQTDLVTNETGCKFEGIFQPLKSCFTSAVHNKWELF